jgi:hypothetical protein
LQNPLFATQLQNPLFAAQATAKIVIIIFKKGVKKNLFLVHNAPPKK